MRGIGTYGNKFLLLTVYGLFEYDGTNWQHRPEAYSIESLKGRVFPALGEPLASASGPRILNVGDSLVVPQSRVRDASKGPTFVMGVSEDGGETWEQGQWILPHPDEFQPVEPSGYVHEDRIILLCRTDGTLNDELIIYVAKQSGVSRSASFPFWEKRTNLKLPSGFRDSGLRGVFLDTNEIFYNHVTNQFEVLLTDRASSQNSQALSEKISLTLWSIPAANLLAANDSSLNFTKEATLITRRHRKGVGSPAGFDGFHVGGTLLSDSEQRIFFYSGYNKMGEFVSPGAAIFQMKRSLDTPALSEALSAVQ